MAIYILSQKTFAKPTSQYRFSGSTKVNHWPKLNGCKLGAVGAWNLFFRAGLNPKMTDVENLCIPQAGDILIVVADEKFTEQTEFALKSWIKNGGCLVASGFPEAWKYAFPNNTSITQDYFENPYSALAWQFDDTTPELVSPPNWNYLCIKKNGNQDVNTFGNLVAIGGERQTPGRALTTQLKNAPAIIQIKNFFYFNANPFASLQSWLQGQEDLSPWLEWRHRLFWLDEYASYLLQKMKKLNLIPAEEKRISGLADITVVLRHDLDYSRDTTYLEMENEYSLTGVHAILKDNNTSFWVEKLASAKGHEVAFHFNTGSYSRVIEAIRNIIFKLPIRPLLADRKAICGKGLLKQVKWARKNGIGTQTLHRHLAFIIYPELVEALDHVYQNEKNVLGGSNFFRGQILRWGIETPDGTRGTYGTHPDPQFPYWFPFHLSNAADNGRMLSGWEGTSMMELEPEFFEQMLNHKTTGFPQKIIVLNYHPAHAKGETFTRGGSAKSFKIILDLCKKNNIEVKTLAQVYKTLNNQI